MNTHGMSEKSSRGQLSEWRTGMWPLLRRMGPRWGVCLVLLAGLWLAGAHFSTRYDSLTPQAGLVPIALRDYVKRGQDIPKEDNAATFYGEAEGQLDYRNNWKSDSEEAFRLCRYFRDNSFKLTAANWQVLAAFAAETDGVIGKIREARLRPKCVVLQSDSGHDFYCWQTPNGVEGCLAIRAHVAAHFGKAPAWREAADDLLGFVETIQQDLSSPIVELQRSSLAALLQSLEEACASGAAADDSFLAALDGRLARLRPMEAFEPLLTLAWSTIDFRHSTVYWGIYPRYFSKKLMTGKSFYPEFLDIPYRVGGFAARDRILSTAYVSGLLDTLRSGQPDLYVQAWEQMAGPASRAGVLGRDFTPRYDQLAWETARSEWHGAPATLYANAACIRMARAVIAVMRQGRDERGLLRNQDYLKGLLHDLSCPMTGEPIICRADSHRCDLWYRVATGSRRYHEHWEVSARVVPASAACS